MTLSGQGSTGNFMGTYGWDVYVKWTATQSQSGNYSDVTAILYTKGRYSGGNFWANASKANITINGASETKTLAYSTSGTETKEVMRKTVRVAHGSDGSKSFSISAWFQPNFQNTSTGQWINQQVTSSGSWTLDKIARAGGLTWNTADYPHTFGKDARFSITNFVSSYYYYIQLSVGNETRQVLTASRSSSPTMSIPLDMVKNMPNATKGGGKVRLITSTSGLGWGNGTLIGYTDYSIEITVPGDLRPVINSITFADQSNTWSKLGFSQNATTFIKRYSIARANISYTKSYDSPVYSFEFYIGSNLINSNKGYLTDINLTSIPSGNQTLKVVIKDDRGRTAEKTIGITVLDYSPPQINLVRATRQTADATKADLVRSGVITSIKVGTTEYNSATVTTYVKESTASSYPTSTSHISTSIGNIVIDSLATNKAYVVKTIVSDKLSTTTAEINISTAFNLLHFYHDSSNDGIGLGKTYEKGHGVLDVGGRVTMNDNYIDGGGGFYNGFLPGGDTRLGSYWLSNNFTPGISMYYANPGVANPPTNMPASWGFCVVHKLYKTSGDFTVMFYTQVGGDVYRISGNTSTATYEWQNLSKPKRAATEVGLPYGIKGQLVREGNLVVLSVGRTDVNWTGSGENIKASETLPTGYRPNASVTMTLNANYGGQVKAPILIHFNAGSNVINSTSYTQGHSVFTGNCTWYTDDPMP